MIRSFKKYINKKLSDSALEDKYISAKIALLLGANPNKRTNYGSYPIIDAYDHRIVKALVKKGANPNFINDYKRSPLFTGALNDNNKSIDFLIKKYVNPFQRDFQHKNSLELTKNPDIRKKLIKYMNDIANKSTKGLPSDIKRHVKKFLFSRKKQKNNSV
jgi:hypothetical protein